MPSPRHGVAEVRVPCSGSKKQCRTGRGFDRSATAWSAWASHRSSRTFPAARCASRACWRAVRAASESGTVSVASRSPVAASRVPRSRRIRSCPAASMESKTASAAGASTP
ncbi:hypothetical protein NI17_015680 [Thermobifida halotolerans]|uniref:Uncharacterized protein n=1 Tax=Thermobifida halotolerans TaxID=483545 RepID=A0AA97LUG5_9ACTN|nr:hypothetical protein [Thermobifida halotolerans]UOE18274.1 hypothetical protein NI17_015680 [Thermobifida halotolerans]